MTSHKKQKPNLFIVGAPRCGTTSLYTYLSAHPDIYMPSNKKEPGFFGRDVYPRTMSLERYLQLFKNGENKKYRGEASTWYLYSKTTAKEIELFNPESKIIIIIRNPIEAIYSFYYFNRLNGKEPLSFKRALEAEKQRKKGRNLPKRPHPRTVVYHYKSIYKYFEQIKRYYDIFGKEDVKVILFEEFKAKTAATYKKTLKFLGVDDSYKPESFEVINPNKNIKSRFLYNIYAGHTTLLVAKKLMPKSIRTNVGKIIHSLNTKVDKRPTMARDIKAKLVKEFTLEVHKISKLIGNDLSYWLNE